MQSSKVGKTILSINEASFWIYVVAAAALFFWKYFFTASFQNLGIRLTPVVIFVSISALLKLLSHKPWARMVSAAMPRWQRMLIIFLAKVNTTIETRLIRGRTSQAVFAALMKQLFPPMLALWLVAGFFAMVFPARFGVRIIQIDIDIAMAIVALLWFVMRNEPSDVAQAKTKATKPMQAWQSTLVILIGSGLIVFALYGVVAVWVLWLVSILATLLLGVMIYMVGYGEDGLN